MTIQYRRGQLSDLEELVELRILMQSEVNHINDLSKDRLDSFKQKCAHYFEEYFNNKNYHCVVALNDQKIIATAGVCFYRKPPSLLGDSNGLVGYVTNVYTRTNFREKGIGTQMMNEIKKLAESLKADKLHLGATEDGAGIYRTVGFTEPRFLTLELKINY